MPQSLFDKLWDIHLIDTLGDGMDLVRIDRHLLHDLSGPGSMKALLDRGLSIHAPDLTFGTPDHGISTEPGRTGATIEANERALSAFRAFSKDLSVKLFDLDGPDQGIVHVIGPELGLSLPGLTIVCGDSHTCTHGAFGALAWGIGSTEITHVLASQALVIERPRSMRVTFVGDLNSHVSAKDMILHLIGTYGADGGAGCAVEFAGETIRTLDMEGRMTLCNLAVEFGARFGFVAPDEKTMAYVQGRRFAPSGELWDKATVHWRTLRSDQDCHFDQEIEIDVSALVPQITWGTSPEHTLSIDGTVPEPDESLPAQERAAIQKALDYMGLDPGKPIAGVPVQHVFIGSCTNSRLSDLRAAAEIVKGRKVASGVKAWVVPGSKAVKRMAESEGLDKLFIAAGFSWREPGCSMCLAMNGDQVPRGERCVSTSNRNFVGRQGPGARTHLASPETAAATAITGRLTHPGELDQ